MIMSRPSPDKVFAFSGALDIEAIQKILLAMIVVWAGYDVFVLSKYVLLNPTVDVVVPSKVGEEDLPLQEEPVKDFAAYRALIAKHRLFGGDGAAVPPPAISLPELPAPIPYSESHYKLIGIMVSQKQPRAAIHDTMNQKMFFLSPGDSFNGMVLEAIHPDKVIFLDGKQRVELKP